jgi:hypothetical protein
LNNAFLRNPISASEITGLWSHSILQHGKKLFHGIAVRESIRLSVFLSATRRRWRPLILPVNRFARKKGSDALTNEDSEKPHRVRKGSDLFFSGEAACDYRKPLLRCSHKTSNDMDLMPVRWPSPLIKIRRKPIAGNWQLLITRTSLSFRSYCPKACISTFITFMPIAVGPTIWETKSGTRQSRSNYSNGGERSWRRATPVECSILFLSH